MTRQRGVLAGLATVLAAVTLAAAACGDDDSAEGTAATGTSDTSAVCTSASQLESDINSLEGLDSGSSFEDVTNSVSTVVADVGDLENAASSDLDLSNAVDDLSSSVDELESAVKDLPDASSGEDALNSLSSPLDDVSSSLDELQSAASCN